MGPQCEAATGGACRASAERSECACLQLRARCARGAHCTACSGSARAAAIVHHEARSGRSRQTVRAPRSQCGGGDRPLLELRCTIGVASASTTKIDSQMEMPVETEAVFRSLNRAAVAADAARQCAHPVMSTGRCVGGGVLGRDRCCRHLRLALSYLASASFACSFGLQVPQVKSGPHHYAGGRRGVHTGHVGWNDAPRVRWDKQQAIPALQALTGTRTLRSYVTGHSL
eukprot:COSAG06_NODE_6345_length_2975_cov_189.004868_2_plen_229_part_00